MSESDRGTEGHDTGHEAPSESDRAVASPQPTTLLAQVARNIGSGPLQRKLQRRIMQRRFESTRCTP
jgi:hypothetical protein